MVQQHRALPPPPDDDRLVSKKQVVQALNISLSTLNRLLKERKLPVCRIGRRRVGIPNSALQRFIREGTK